MIWTAILSAIKPIISFFEKILPYLIGGLVIWVLIKLYDQKAKIEELNTVVSFHENAYASSEEMLKKTVRLNDSLLRAHDIKPKSVEKVIGIRYYTQNNFSDTTIVSGNDTMKCIDVNIKGVSVKGCNGSYTLTQDFTATGFVYMKNTKKFLGIFPYKKKPVLKAWTSYGDSVNVTLIEK